MPNARVVIDKRRQLDDGTYPIKLKVGHTTAGKFIPKYYAIYWEGIKVTMTDKAWQATQARRPPGEAKVWATRWKAFELKAEQIIRDICRRGPFDFDQFRERWTEKLGDRGNVFFWYDKQMEKFSDSPGNREKYQYSRVSLQKYCNCEELSFQTVTAEWLRNYEQWMLKQGRNLSTVSIHLRHLRAVFNRARSEGCADNYPFGKHRYQIPKPKAAKRALTADQLLKLYEYTGEPESLDAFARDMFMLSYLLAGLNMADLFRIRWEQIDGDTLTMTRKKTGQPLTLYISEEAWEIIRRHMGQRNIAGYVFPYLKDRMTEKRKRDEVKRLTARINEHLQAIAPDLGLPEGITTYWARHTFATIAKGLGLPVAWVKEALSHSSVAVTENYLSNFEAEKRRTFTEKISIWK